MPDGILQQQSAENHRCHERRRRTDAETEAERENGRQAVEARVDDPGAERAGQAQRRGAPELAEVERLATRGRWSAGLCEQHGHEGQGENDRSDAEEMKSRGIGDRQQKLTTAGPEVVGDHVECHHLSPGPVGRARIEPALRDQDHAGHTEARCETQEAPHDRIDHNHVQQSRHRHDRGKCGERADMPNGGDHVARAQRALQETEEVGGHDQPDDLRVEAFDLAADPEKGAEQAVGEKQKTVAEEKGKYRANRHQHAARFGHWLRVSICCRGRRALVNGSISTHDRYSETFPSPNRPEARTVKAQTS